jgi:hypothetical protein
MAVIAKISIVAGISLLLAIVNAPNAIAANDSPEAKQVDAVFADLVKPGSPGCALAAARGRGFRICARRWPLFRHLFFEEITSQENSHLF